MDSLKIERLSRLHKQFLDAADKFSDLCFAAVTPETKPLESLPDEFRWPYMPYEVNGSIEGQRLGLAKAFWLDILRKPTGDPFCPLDNVWLRLDDGLWEGGFFCDGDRWDDMQAHFKHLMEGLKLFLRLARDAGKRFYKGPTLDCTAFPVKDDDATRWLEILCGMAPIHHNSGLLVRCVRGDIFTASADAIEAIGNCTQSNTSDLNNEKQFAGGGLPSHDRLHDRASEVFWQALEAQRPDDARKRKGQYFNTFSTLINRFLRITSRYWQHYQFEKNAARIIAESIDQDKKAGYKTDISGLVSDLSKNQRNTNSARKALVKLGHVLAVDLERHSEDSTALLELLNAADGGGGPSSAAPLWQPLKASLQRIAIRSTLPDSKVERLEEQASEFRQNNDTNAEAETIWPANIYNPKDNVIPELKTLGEVADTARILYAYYPNDAGQFHRDKQILEAYRDKDTLIQYQYSELRCRRSWRKVQGLAMALPRLLPSLWPKLRLIGQVDSWHECKNFDWDAAIGELRRIEADGLTDKSMAPLIADKKEKNDRNEKYELPIPTLPNEMNCELSEKSLSESNGGVGFLEGDKIVTPEIVSSSEANNADGLRQDSPREKDNVMPMDSKATLHTAILDCIAKWRWLLGLERVVRDEPNADKRWKLWLALHRLHNAWCEYSKCVPTEFDGLYCRLPESDATAPPVRCLGLESTSYHRATGEAVGQVLKSLEPKLRPVPWQWSHNIETNLKPEGWSDGVQDDDPNWWPFFNPCNSDVNIPSIFSLLRYGKRDLDGSSNATHGLLHARSWVLNEWMKTTAKMNSKKDSSWKYFHRPRSKHSISSLYMPPGDVANSFKLVNKILETLRGLQANIQMDLSRVPWTDRMHISPLRSNKIVEATGRSWPEIACFIAEIQLNLSHELDQFKQATRPLIVEFASARVAPIEIGEVMYSCAAEALDTIILELEAAPTYWSIPKFIRRVAPICYGYDWEVLSYSIFLRDFYHVEDIKISIEEQNKIQKQNMEEYIRINASQPVDSPEELWVRMVNAPDAPIVLGESLLFQRYDRVLEVGKERLCKVDIDLLEVELKAEHAKVATARGLKSHQTFDNYQEKDHNSNTLGNQIPIRLEAATTAESKDEQDATEIYNNELPLSLIPPRSIQWKDQNPIKLTNSQYNLIEYLVREDIACKASYSELIDNVIGHEIKEKSIQSALSRFNEKLLEGMPPIPITLAWENNYVVLLIDRK